MNQQEKEDGLVLLYVTYPDESSAQNISIKLIELKLAACTNMIKGVRSTYSWQNKVESSEETILIIKTRFKLSESCQKMILKHHPYNLPCILELPVHGGHPAYLNWLYEATDQGLIEP